MEAIIKQFLSIVYGSGYGYGNGSGNGYGYGDGSGSGSGYGNGYGNGSGSGYGNGSGSGSGNGYGYGDGDGSGYGNGYGSGYGNGNGYGYGNGSGDGDGYGYGDGIKSINGNTVYLIDEVQTVIYSIKRNIAKAATINSDLTLTSCYVAKIGNSFAHGKTIKQAVADATNKDLEARPLSERLKMFTDTFKVGKKYPAKMFFDWHNVLTGSCFYGREQFCKDNGIDVNKDKLTVADFIKLTRTSYGGDAIKELEKMYEQ
jgi:hypothetical protein